MAGLNRLGLSQHATRAMSVEEFLPAVAQGAIGIETRGDDNRTRQLVARINHTATFIAVACERAFLAALDGSCKTPLAGHATLSDDTLHFRGLIARPDGKPVATSPGNACEGQRCASLSRDRKATASAPPRRCAPVVMTC